MAGLRKVQNTTFRNEHVSVDGRQFIHCTFINCKLVFTGLSVPDYQKCVFEDCQWVFEGFADNTLRYLMIVYTDAGGEGRALVEAIFEDLRDRARMEEILGSAPEQVANS